MIEFIIGYMLGLTTLYYTPYIFNKSTIKQNIEDLTINVLDIYKKDIEADSQKSINTINDYILELKTDIQIISSNLEELKLDMNKSNTIKKGKTASL